MKKTNIKYRRRWLGKKTHSLWSKYRLKLHMLCDLLTKKKKLELPHDPAVIFLSIYTEDLHSYNRHT